MTAMNSEERFAEIDDSIEEMGRRLRTIARQNADLAEMVRVLGDGHGALDDD